MSHFTLVFDSIKTEKNKVAQIELKTELLEGIPNWRFQKNGYEWLISGNPFYKVGNKYVPIDNLLVHQVPTMEDAAFGAYVIIKWNQQGIQVVTDTVGLRDLYYFHDIKNHCLFLSSSAFEIATRVGTPLKLDEIASSWICYNKINQHSLYEGIQRVVQGKNVAFAYDFEATIRQQRLEYPNSNPHEQLIHLFESIDLGHREAFLALSGGVDSRYLLSIMMAIQANFTCCSYGSVQDNLDSRIAEQICEEVGIKHQCFVANSNNVTTQSIKEDLSYTYSYFLTPQHVLRLRENEALDKGRVVFDGGFGEIFRGAFLKKIQWQGKKALKYASAKDLLPLLSDSKPNIFRDHIWKELKDSVIAELDRYLNNQDIEVRSNPSDWIKEFSFKSRLPNFYGSEQLKNDHYQLNIMPFTWAPVLLGFLNTSRNPIDFKKHIHHTILRQFPLIKGDLSIPFRTPTMIVPILKRLHTISSPKIAHTQNEPIKLTEREMDHPWIDPDKWTENNHAWYKAFFAKVVEQ